MQKNQIKPNKTRNKTTTKKTPAAFLPGLPALSGTSSRILTSPGDKRQAYLILRTLFAMSFRVITFIKLRWVQSIPDWVCVFIMNGC